MKGFRAFAYGAGIAALAASASGQSEIFPNVHNQPIVIHIVDGRDGKPLAHTRLSLVGGYTRRDLHLQMWHEEAFTDDQGRARMSSAMENLPILQIEVAKSHLCADSRSATALRAADPDWAARFAGAHMRDGVTGRAIAGSHP